MDRIWARAAAGLVLAASLVIPLAGCGHSGPSQAACKKAMERQFSIALATAQQQAEPAACKGLSAAVLQKLAGQVLSGQ